MNLRASWGEGLTALVIDDERAIQIVLGRSLERFGFDVTVCGSREEVLQHLERCHFDVVLVDKNLPDGSGLELIRTIRETNDDSVIVAMSAYVNLPAAMEAIRLQVADFLCKPFSDLEDVAERLRRAVEFLRVQRQNRTLLAELQSRNQELEALVVRDGLTGLFNHAFLHDRLEHELQRCRRHERSLGVIFIDIDHFKRINDAFGHHAGDEVLRASANLMKKFSRASDDSFRIQEGVVAARHGGDEFVVVLPETSKSGAVQKAERLRQLVEAYDFGEHLPPLTLSLGVVAYPDDANSRDGLMVAADAALYAAKRTGRNKVMPYSTNILPMQRTQDIAAKTIEIWEHAIDESLRGNLFNYVYQPIVASHDCGIIGYEALCRPSHQMFESPYQLILAAEKVGQVWPVGRALRKRSVAPLEQLPADRLLFVNLHPDELYDPELLLLHEVIGPDLTHRVVLEITESKEVHDYGRALERIAALRAQGFRVALDDLGAGYSGLNALARLQPDYVKLDRAMLADAESGGRQHRLLKHLLEYTQEEGILVIAEGIEDAAQFDLAVQLQIPFLQGFLFAPGRPPFVELSMRPSAVRAGNAAAFS